MTAETTALLLPLLDFCHSSINHQELPIVCRGIEAGRALDHYHQELRLSIVGLCQFFTDNDRAERKSNGRLYVQSLMGRTIHENGAERAAALVIGLVLFGSGNVADVQNERSTAGVY